MLKAKLEKRPTRDPQSSWWLKLNGVIEPESFQLPRAIESRAILNKMMETNAHKLVIDFSDVKEFDSQGVRLLVMLYKQFSERDMSITLYNLDPYLSRVLRIMQLDRLFEVESDKNHRSDN